jgi:hypothetical protein
MMTLGAGFAVAILAIVAGRLAVRAFRTFIRNLWPH